MFHIADPLAAWELYREAFGAVKTSDEYLPNGDPNIGIKIDTLHILLRPGDGEGGCYIRFTTETDLRHAYEVLTREGSGSINTDYHWTTLAAHVNDKFNCGWFFCID